MASNCWKLSISARQGLPIILLFVWSTESWSSPIAQADEIFASLSSVCMCVSACIFCVLVCQCQHCCSEQKSCQEVKEVGSGSNPCPAKNWQAPTAELSGCQLWHRCQSAHITRARYGPLLQVNTGPRIWHINRLDSCCLAGISYWESGNQWPAQMWRVRFRGFLFSSWREILIWSHCSSFVCIVACFYSCCKYQHHIVFRLSSGITAISGCNFCKFSTNVWTQWWISNYWVWNIRSLWMVRYSRSVQYADKSTVWMFVV